MKKLLFFSLLILPLTVFAQIKIDISPYFVNDSSRVSYWSINGKKLNISDFPFLLEWTKNSLDTIVFIHSSSGTLKYDTTFVLFPKKSNLLFTPDNDGSFDIIRKHSMKRGKNRAKFIVKNTGSDTIICCFARLLEKLQKLHLERLSILLLTQKLTEDLWMCQMKLTKLLIF